MSHLSSHACTQRLAAERGDGYQVTWYQLAAATAGSVAFSQNGRALHGRSSGEA